MIEKRARELATEIIMRTHVVGGSAKFQGTHR
jgi:hypothetical protein